MARTSILPKTKIREFFEIINHGGDFQCYIPEFLARAKRIETMACSFVDVRRNTRKWDPRRKRDSGIGVNKILTESEQEKMFAFLSGSVTDIDKFKNLLIWDILINTGVRASELCNLRLKDTPRYLGKNAIFIYRGKGQKDRTVPVSARLAGKINEWLDDFRPQLLPVAARKNDPNRPVFYSYRRRRYTANALYKKITALAKRAGIKKQIHPHMTRHTFATYQLLGGVNIGSLQRLLGHSSIKTTQRYLHLVELLNVQLGEQLDMFKKYSETAVSGKNKS